MKVVKEPNTINISENQKRNKQAVKHENWYFF